jgi:hypothetical protein
VLLSVVIVTTGTDLWKAAVWGYEFVYAGNMASAEPVRGKSLIDYRKKLLEHKEVESRLKESMHFLQLLPFFDKYYFIMHANLDFE